MKQKFELGQKVWAFKQQGKELKKVLGIVECVKIDASGFIFYEISTLVQTKEGISVGSITAEQKKKFEDIFGGSEFEPDYVTKQLTEGA